MKSKFRAASLATIISVGLAAGAAIAQVDVDQRQVDRPVRRQGPGRGGVRGDADHFETALAEDGLKFQGGEDFILDNQHSGWHRDALQTPSTR